jgi:uncharacterized membrane protein YfhO
MKEGWKASKTVLVIASLFIALDLVFLRWVFIHFGNWGIWDWDYQLTLLEVSRRSVLEYHQLPLWNPFMKGGVSLAGNTLMHAWGPCFIPVLLFGTVMGVKVCIVLYLLIAQCGMFLLARHNGLSRKSAFLSACLYALGGVYAQRLTHGHFEWIAIAWIPFIVLTIHHNMRRFNKKSLCLGGMCFAFLFLDGGPYQFAFLGVFLALYISLLVIQGKSLRTPAAAAIIVTLGISVASIKLIPMYETVTQYPREGGEFGFYGLTEPPRASSMLYQMFLSRNQRHDPGDWMPYKLNVGCYVGWIPLLLACAGVCFSLRRNWPLILAGLVTFWIMLGPSAPVDIWHLLQKLPLLHMLRIPSRFNVFVLFTIALLAGEGMERLQEKAHKMQRARFIPLFTVALIALDLLWVNGKVFRVAFCIPPLPAESNGDFKNYAQSPYLEHYRNRAVYHIFHNLRSAVLPAVRENRGVIDTFSTINCVAHAFSFDDPSYRGEAWIEEEAGKVLRVAITPNRIKVETNGAGKTLLINQNYDSGWRARGKQTVAISSRNGLISADISPGQREIEFVYFPSSFLAGALITLIAWVLILYTWLSPRRGKMVHVAKPS